MVSSFLVLRPSVLTHEAPDDDDGVAAGRRGRCLLSSPDGASEPGSAVANRVRTELPMVKMTTPKAQKKSARADEMRRMGAMTMMAKPVQNRVRRMRVVETMVRMEKREARTKNEMGIAEKVTWVTMKLCWDESAVGSAMASAVGSASL